MGSPSDGSRDGGAPGVEGPPQDEELSFDPTTPWERIELDESIELASIEESIELESVEEAPDAGNTLLGMGAVVAPIDPAMAATIDASNLEVPAPVAPPDEPPKLYAPHLEPPLAADQAAANEPAPNASLSMSSTALGLPNEPMWIGRFQVLRRLGAGGMGVVVSAYDERLDRRVALKLLRRESRDNQRSAGRIKREAQALAKLNHPNVVPVWDVGEWEGQIYLAMEHVDGVTLKQWSEATRDWRDVLAMHLQAGRGLAAAHAAGLIHRDYKPANVLVGDDGRARVLDFGLVRARTREETAHDASRSRAGLLDDSQPEIVDHPTPMPKRGETALERDLTQAGAVMGTPAYMSPEQRMGKVVDARSDQFSFCVVVYEALFGHHPFEARTAEEQLHLMMDEEIQPPAASGTGADVPREVVDALARGLARDPDSRWPAIQDLLDVLDRARERSVESDPAEGKTHRAAAFALLGAVTLVILVGLMIPEIRDRYIYTVPAAVAVAAVGLVLVLAILVLGRDTLLGSPLNRRLFFWLSVTVGGMLLTRLAALALETPFQHVFVKEQALILVATSMAGVLVDRWAVWIAFIWAVGLSLSLFVVPGHAVMVSTCAVLASCVFAAALWGPASRT